MRKALVFSFLMHAGIAVFAYVGIPVSNTPLAEPVEIIAVEIAFETETPERVSEVPKMVRPEKAPPPPPEEEPQVAAIPPPEPPKPDTVPIEPVAPEPVPVPVPVEAPPEAEPEPVLPAMPKPKPTPPPEEDFVESMMKAIEPLDDKAPQKPPEKTETEDLMGDLAALLSPDKPAKPEAQLTPKLGNELTISELDVVRRQIKQCWSVPIGARNPEELAVVVKLYMNRDGTVRKAEIVDSARMRSDPFFRAVAESAQRAVLNPKCAPLKLPKDKYDQWQVFTMRFDPSKMVGR